MLFTPTATALLLLTTVDIASCFIMSSGGKWRSRYASAGDDNEDTNTKFTTTDVIESNQKLLDSIARCDYETYKELCADDITAFEPESNGMMITGLSFHKYYFDLYGSGSNSSGQQDVSKAATSETTQANDNDSNKSTTKVNICMSNPHVRWLGGGCCSDGCGDGSAAVISYVRMDQKIEDATSGPVTKISSETRVWENRDGRLVHVHFHKS
jgi:calcium/calmodulin-dependent protein kinase (CaM kinase) II